MFKKNVSKKWIACLIAFMMMLSVALPLDSVKVFADSNNSVTLQILATSDTHGRFLPYDYALNAPDTSGSLAQVSTAVKAARATNPDNTLLVDAGDIIQDNSADLFLNDDTHPMIAAMNAMNYDAIELGNHEFNYGIPTLKKVMSKSAATVICANLYDKDGKTRIFAPYKIVTTKGGIKVGLIGIVSPNITRWDAENLKGYKVTDPLVEVQNAIKELQGQVDVMIGVFHESETPEYGTANSGADEIAAKCPELTAIIAAHEHKQVDHKVYSNKVVLVENKSGGQTLANLNITLTKQDGKYVVANRDTDVTSKVDAMKTVQPDANLVQALSTYDQKAKDDANKVIGKLVGGDLVPANEVKGIPTAQVQETAMIDLINKVQMYYSGADVSAAAAFSDTANIKAGDIKKCGTASIYKYNNTLYLLQVTGKQLKEYMEWSAKYYNQYKPGDLTISFNPNIRGYNYDMFTGVKYGVDVSKPEGKRIVNLTRMNGKPIKDTDVLKLAVNNYRASSQLSSFGEVYNEKNGDKLPTILAKDMVQGTPVRDLIGKYIQNVKHGVIKPDLDHNWKMVGFTPNAAKRALAVKAVNAGLLTLPTSADGRTPNVAALTDNDLSKIPASNLKAWGYKTVDIVSFNDLHGAVSQSSSNPGIAKLGEAIREAQAANKNTIVVSAGDNYQGSAVSNLTYGAPINDFMKSVNVTASAVGNHEFDWGSDRIAGWAKTGNFDYLAANIVDKTTGKPVSWAKPYKVVKVGGIKIGLVGLTTLDCITAVKADYIKDFTFTDPVKAADEWATKLKSGKLPEGKVDAVVVVCHLASYQTPGPTDRDDAALVAQGAKNVDAIISGHSHTEVCKVVNGKPIIQSLTNGQDLGKTSIIVAPNGKILSIGASNDQLSKRMGNMIDDYLVKAIADKYVNDLAPIQNEVVGSTDKDLTHVKAGGPSLLGEWVTDVMRKSAGADIAITNGGGLRCTIPQGNITMGKLYEVMPFDNFLVTIDMKGSDVKKAIECGIAPVGKGWAQVSGVYVTYDATKPAGQRIVSMKTLDGKDFDMTKTYKVVVNDFMYVPAHPAQGGDGYDLSGATNAKYGESIRDALANELKTVKTLSVTLKGYMTDVNAK